MSNCYAHWLHKGKAKGGKIRQGERKPGEAVRGACISDKKGKAWGSKV